MIQFLEFVMFIFALYLISQHLIPTIWPNQFEKNWLFKKKKPIDDRLNTLTNEKERLENELNETIIQSEVERKRAEDIINQAKKLK